MATELPDGIAVESIFAIEARYAPDAASDVYMRTGVWVELRVRPFGRVCRSDEVGGR